MQVRAMLMLAPFAAALLTDVAFAEDGGAEVAAATVESDLSPEEAAEQARIEFSKQLRTVEENVGSLKERVFRSKATLQLLKELVVDSAAVGSRIVVAHVNKLGGAYSMESVSYLLDGRAIYSKVDPAGSLDVNRDFVAHEEALPPGQHNLQVNLVLRGKGFKVFSYLQSYQFKVQSSYAFEVAEGELNSIRVIAESRGGLKSFVDRPAIRYDSRVESIREE